MADVPSRIGLLPDAPDLRRRSLRRKHRHTRGLFPKGFQPPLCRAWECRESEGEQGHSQPARRDRCSTVGRRRGGLRGRGRAHSLREPIALIPSWKQRSAPRSSRFRSRVGLYMWNRDPWTRFAKLLVIAGFAWSLTTLAQSSSEVLYSAGRVFGWFVEPFLIFLVLAFPSGRLTARPERALVAASRAARRSPLPADDAARGLLPDALSLDQLRRGLPGQRLHGARLRAGLRGRRDHSIPRDGDRAAVRRRGCGARRADSERHAADAHHARCPSSRLQSCTRLP